MPLDHYGVLNDPLPEPGGISCLSDGSSPLLSLWSAAIRLSKVTNFHLNHSQINYF
jgi:hypothetical protein